MLRMPGARAPSEPPPSPGRVRVVEGGGEIQGVEAEIVAHEEPPRCHQVDARPPSEDERARGNTRAQRRERSGLSFARPLVPPHPPARFPRNIRQHRDEASLKTQPHRRRRRLPRPHTIQKITHVHLRRKTEEGGEPRVLHTIRGVGYIVRPPSESDWQEKT